MLLGMSVVVCGGGEGVGRIFRANPGNVPAKWPSPFTITRSEGLMSAVRHCSQLATLCVRSAFGGMRRLLAM